MHISYPKNSLRIANPFNIECLAFLRLQHLIKTFLDFESGDPVPQTPVQQKTSKHKITMLFMEHKNSATEDSPQK